MSHHYGGQIDIGPLWLDLMPTPTSAALYAIPQAFEDEDHHRGFELEPRGSTPVRSRVRMVAATGELARLLCRS